MTGSRDRLITSLMTNQREKATLDEVTFYEFMRDHEKDVVSSVRIVKLFYDTKDSRFLNEKVRLRLRSLESAGRPMQFDLSVKVGPTCLSCILRNSDAMRVMDKPECLKNVLPAAIRNRFADKFEGFDQSEVVCLGTVFVERTYVAIQDLLVAVDACFHDGDRFWEAHLYHNNAEAGKKIFVSDLQRLKCDAGFACDSMMSRFPARSE